MTHFTKKIALGSTALVTALSLSSGAFAQAIDEIVVTAQKREQTLQETPVSVAVVSDEQIEKSQIRDAADIQTLVPALRVAEFATATNTEFSLRGIGTSSFNPGLEPSVGVFIDGVYRPRAGAAINDLLGVQRVEVIRGPQSTLFGRNTPAGVVSIITKDPSEEFGAEAELTAGSYGQFITKGAITGPITDRVSGRLDLTYHVNDGYLENVPDGREINNRDRFNSRGKILADLNNGWELTLIADYGHIKENCCAAPFANYDPVDAFAINGLGGTLLPADPFDEQIAVDGRVFTDLETLGFSAQLEKDWEGVNFVSITAIREYDEDQQFDADFSDLDLVSIRSIQNHYISFTQEFRLTSTGDNFIDWMAGAFYYDNQLDYDNATPYGSQAKDFFNFASSPTVAPIVAGLGLPAGTGGITLLELFLNANNAAGVGSVVPLPSGQNALPTVPAEGYIAPVHGLISEKYDYNTRSVSFFGNLDFNLTDQLTVTVGGRLTNETKDLSTEINVPDPISQFSFADLGQDLRLVSPTTCDPGLFPVIGGDACAFLVPSLLFGQAQAEASAGDPTLLNTLVALGISPTTPLTAAQAQNPALNQLLGFRAFQNFPPVDESDFPSSRSDSNFDWNIIVSYDVSDTFNVYASYSTGFKPGGFNVSTDAARTGVFEFREENAESFEVGAKGSLLGGGFTYAAALFFQEIEDFQSNNFVGNGFALDNAGSIEVSGLEFEGLFAPTERLVFTGGFTYLFESKYGEYEFAPCPDVGIDGTPVYDPADPKYQLCLPGNERTNDAGVTASFNDFGGVDRGNSEFVGALTGTYTQPIGDNLEGYIRGEVTYTSEFFHTTTQDPRPFARQDDFALFNASVGLGADDGAWEVQVWGRNIGDENYTKGGFPSVGYLGTSYNTYVGDPATYGVTLRLRK